MVIDAESVSGSTVGTDAVFGIGSARWPDGPSQSGVAQGFNLILVSGVNEAVGDGKTGGNGVERQFNKDMTNDEMTFEAHKQTVKPLSQMCDHIWRASVRSEKKVRVCAYGEVLSVHTPSRSWQLPLSGRETA